MTDPTQRDHAGLGDHASALFQMVGLGSPGYRRSDLVALAGIDHDQTVRWWRAMGFPEVGEEVPAFAELDVEVVRRINALTGSGLLDDDSVLRLARLLGASFARIAETQVDILEMMLSRLPGDDADVTSRERLAALVAERDESVLDLMEDTVVYVWRRHLLAALGRRLTDDESAVDQAVGFADLSGFTKLTQRLPRRRLAEIIDAFEKCAFDVVATHNARVVKLIGDEILFVAPDAATAVEVALDLGDRLRAIDGMPPIHCGIAVGPTTLVGGDIFGPTTNLAARLTTVARPGTIVLPRRDATALADRDDIELSGIRRPIELKGIGATRVVKVRRARGA